MTRKRERIWVSPEFRKKIKTEATQKGLSIMEFTDNIGKANNSIEEFLVPKKKKPRGFYDNLF